MTTVTKLFIIYELDEENYPLNLKCKWILSQEQLLNRNIDLKLFNDSNHEKYTLVQTPTVYPEKYTKSR